MQKSAAVLADYGFNRIKLDDDWNGADFLAYHMPTLEQGEKPLSARSHSLLGPLHKAAGIHKAGMVAMILDRGANIDVRGGSNGQTPCTWLCIIRIWK